MSLTYYLLTVAGAHVPTSYIGNASNVIMQVMLLDPKSVLDVGVGFGRWGFLCREMLDVLNERVTKDRWKVRIEGIEVYEPYIQEHHRHIYDSIHIGNASDVIKTLDRFDLVIIGDMLEHLKKEEAWELFHDVMERTDKALILNLPIGQEWLRETDHDNPYEDHLSWWTLEEFDNYRPNAKMNTLANGWQHATIIIRAEEYKYVRMLDRVAQMGKQDTDNAYNLLAQVRAIIPDRAESYMIQAEICINAGRIGDAEAVLTEMAGNCSEYHKGRLMLAMLLRNLGRESESLGHYLHLYEHAPDGAVEKKAAKNALNEMGALPK